MPHPLEKFDDQQKYAFIYKGEKLFVRFITSAASAAKSPEAAFLLGGIGYETQNRLIEKLQEKGFRDAQESWLENPLKNPQEKMDNWVKNDFPAKFEHSDNYTAMVLEDESKKAFCAMSFSINAENEKKFLKVAKEENLIFFDLSQTLKDFSGQGFLKTMRTYLLPDCLLAAGYEKIYMGNSMKKMKAVFPQTSAKIPETDHVIQDVIYDGMPNFGAHASILGFMDPATKMFARWKKDGVDFSREDDKGELIKDFVKDEALLNAWIAKTQKQVPNETLAGCFMVAEVKDLEKLRNAGFKKLEEREGITAEAPNRNLAVLSLAKVDECATNFVAP